MGAITERLSDLAKRCGDLSPIATQVRQTLWDGNKARALAGTDARGTPFAPLKPSTLKRRKGTGPPLAPNGASSAIVTGYVVSVLAGPGRLSCTGSWPAVDWIEYAISGTTRMAARDPSPGWRPADSEKVRKLMQQYIVK